MGARGDHPVHRPVLLYGVHGDEGRWLDPVVGRMVPPEFRVRKVMSRGPYVSTVDPRFYESEVGARWLEVVESLRPFDAYVELHCYRPEAYDRLTRESRGRVPGLVDFGRGVLLGSVPRGHKRVLGEDVLTLTMEVPRVCDSRTVEVAREILELIPGRTRSEFVRELGNRFPGPTEEALRRFRRYYPELEPF